ncbi:MAG: MBL fold metallo-hydrolase [Leptospiraceae bacterium]
MKVTITHIDTACCLIEADGFRILTDPVFDPPGKIYHHGWGAFSRKTSTPAMEPESLGSLDLILLSHHQHKDNLDNTGIQVLGRASRIYSTRAAAATLDNCTGLAPFETIEHSGPQGNVQITGTPCRHHPALVPGFLSGPVTGFLLKWPVTKKYLYISGDTVFFSPLKKIAQDFSVGLALLHVGRASFPYLTGWGKYTMDSADYIKMVQLLNPDAAVPIHNGGWTHFKENSITLSEAIEHYPDVKTVTTIPGPGIPREFELE